MSTMAKELKIGNHIIQISNETKILFPKSKITKGDLIEYYSKASKLIIPFLKDRPLTLRRFPNGIHKDSFYQKNTPEYYPDWIERIAIEKSDKSVIHYVNCTNKATLVFLANQGCIELHPWLSELPNLNNPNKLIFDLDPASAKATQSTHSATTGTAPGKPSASSFDLVRETAFIIKDALKEHGLKSYVMTTGSKGLHVVVPLKPLVNFDIVRDFAKNLANELVSQDPKHLTTEISIKKRGKRVFLDYLRNAWSATAISPYAVRAKENAPVATPLYWEEVKDKKLTSQKYDIYTVFEKIETDGNPWKDFNKNRVKLKT